MKFKIKFKDNIPKFVWLGSRGYPRDSEVLEYSEGSTIHVSTAPSYRAALERIYTSSKMLEPENREKYFFAMIQYLDDQDEDTFYLLLREYDEWYKIIDMDHKNETE